MVPLLLLLLACPGPKPDGDSGADTGADSGVDTGADTGADSGGFDTGACVDVDGDLGDPHAPGCAAAGGVCVGSADQCATGTHLDAYDAECDFDDGTGLCCAPPEPETTGNSCAASGGVCAPIAGCGFVHGWYTPNGDECQAGWGVGTVCCAPEDACEGWGVTTCCTDDGATAFVPSCDRGSQTCVIDQTTLVCDQECAALGG